MIGRTLSHFRIVEKIGEGGMGVVYRAEDTNLRRPVALKVLPPELVGNEERRQRFLREARAAASVSHQNIATVHEVDEADGMVFIAMELVEGKTLRERIGERPMPLVDALRIATEMAEGLATAHKAGVIHRDLKPDNVIVGSDGHVRLLDFGLAKLLEAESGAAVVEASGAETVSAGMTVEGKLLGTPAYMSPEQARGKQVDARSDIFSFGTTLYEMVTGQAPFTGETKTDVLSAVLRETPDPPSRKNPRLPQELDLFLAGCMKKNPGDRYQHALQLAVELRKLERTVAPKEPLDPTLSSAFRAVTAASRKRRSRALMASIALFVAALCVLLCWLILADVGGIRGRLFGRGDIKSLAVLPLENLSGDPEQEFFADGMTEALITDLSKISALKVISRTSAMRYKGSDKALPQIARELGVDALIEGSVLRVGDRVRITAQLIEAATDVHLWAESYEREVRDVLLLQSDVAQAIARKIKVELTPTEEGRLARAGSINPEAHEAYLKGRYHWNKRTSEDLEKAFSWFEQAIKLDPTYALAHAGLADSYAIAADFGVLATHEAYPKGKTAAMKALELDETLAEAHTALAVLLGVEWDWIQCEREHKRAIELSPNRATAHHWYAWYFWRIGKPHEALEELRLAHDLDPLSPGITDDFAYALRIAGQHDQAIYQYQQTINLSATYSPAHFELGDLYEQLGLHDEAIEAWHNGVALVSGEQDAAALDEVYRASDIKGVHRWFIEWYEREAERRYVMPGLVAKRYALLGETDKAFEWLERAYQERGTYLAYIQVDWGFESLRSDRRYADLLSRMGLPPG